VLVAQGCLAHRSGVVPTIIGVPRVLLLARSFPPIGGAGVQRTVGSVRHLRTAGWEPVLVTGPGDRRGRWEPHDDALLAHVPADVEVHRVPGPEPAGPRGMAARLALLRPGPDRWVRWWIEESVRLGRRVGAGVDVVLTSCAPYETALAGARLAAELGTPWVADLEDAWALDEMRLYPTAAHRALDLRSMRRSLAGAAAIVTAAPEAAAAIRRAFPDLADRPVTGVPIGFDPEDFAGAPPPRDDGVFRIVHTGSLHTDLGARLRGTRLRRRLLGGASPTVDILTRSHVVLLEAIASLLRAEPALRPRIELHLAGDMTHADRAAAEHHAFVHVAGQLTHREAVALMRTADLLFLPMHDLAPGTRARLIPYKTYEYLAARRPILAAVPDGDVRDMLAPLDGVTLVRPADADAMARAVRAAIARGPVRELRDGLDSPALRRFDRRRCVAEVAAVLDQVLTSRGSRSTT
jgi:glycosyltransferase involved in cell wall biosynthesis